MTQQQPEASRIVEETATRILDELAVEGGRATRAHLFDKCHVKLWGHVVNVAARRAGYTGADATEVERRGKDQLFQEAVDLVFEREQVVKWDQEGDLLALAPPPYRDDYVPGTNLWRSQRQTVLSEMRDQLQQFRDRHVVGDQAFEATLRKAGSLYEQQLRRGQLKGSAREEALSQLLALADVLFDPARLAKLFGIDEAAVRAAAARRYEPTKAVSARRPSKQARPAEPIPEDEPAPPDEPANQVDEPATQSHEPRGRAEESLSPGTLRREREVRGLTQRELAEQVGVAHSTMGKWESGLHPVNATAARLLAEYFDTHPVANGIVSRSK